FLLQTSFGGAQRIATILCSCFKRTMATQVPNTVNHFSILWILLPKVILYATSTASLMFGVAAQLVAIVIVARHLGVEQFGHLMRTTAATTVAGHLCGLGAGEAMLRRVARDSTLYPVVLGHNIIMLSLSGIILIPTTVACLVLLVQASSDPFE